MFKPRLLVAVLGLLLFTSPAFANLITIGTATYGGSDYNLIWDDDNNGNSVIWLDYKNAYTDWSGQTGWASGLNSALSYNIDAAYSVTWYDATWRLGSTVDGTYIFGLNGTTTGGYNITTSEMGHLFYAELRDSDYTGNFQNIVGGPYWSGTEYLDGTNTAWGFNMGDGLQTPAFKNNEFFGLAVRSGQVSSVAPVPEPGTLLLFGSGIAGLTLYRRRMSKS